jgi:DNA-binding HxlR family transcriptional regulator
MEEGLRETVDLIGRKWMLELLFCFEGEDELRFHHFTSCLGDVSNKTLSKRLKELEERGFLEREEMQTSPTKTCYRLTADGDELLSCLRRMERCLT